jgi:hypothetical protein
MRNQKQNQTTQQTRRRTSLARAGKKESNNLPPRPKDSFARTPAGAKRVFVIGTAVESGLQTKSIGDAYLKNQSPLLRVSAQSQAPLKKINREQSLKSTKERML